MEAESGCHLWLFVQLLLIFVAKVEGTQCGDFESQRLPVFDGKKVYDFKIDTFQAVKSNAECASWCFFNIVCVSYIFNKNTETCSLFAIGYTHPSKTSTPTTAEPGSELYVILGGTISTFGNPCTTDNDCDTDITECFEGQCQCTRGKSYDPLTGTCVVRCSEYGNDFIVIDSYQISGCNNVIEVTSDMQECWDLCKSQPFVCISAEYNLSTKFCQICDKPWFEVAGHVTGVDYSWVLLYRQCVL